MKTIKNQSGRSMVEMLGVLAIIGVLSIGGVAGYRYGMDQIAANKLMNFIQKFYTAMESALIDSNSKMNVICAYGNSFSSIITPNNIFPHICCPCITYNRAAVNSKAANFNIGTNINVTAAC